MAKRVYTVGRDNTDLLVEANSASEAVMIAMNGTVTVKVIETSALLARVRAGEKVWTAEDAKGITAKDLAAEAPDTSGNAPAPAQNTQSTGQTQAPQAATNAPLQFPAAAPLQMANGFADGGNTPPANWMAGQPGAGQAAE